MRRCASVLPLLALVLAGCGSTPDVLEVNDVAMARWESLSDARSRRTITRSFEAAGLRTEDYRIGPEDVVAISVFEWVLREETRILEARVSQSGHVVLPVIGVLAAAGRTTAELQQDVERILTRRSILKSPRVTVEVKEFQSKRVSVVGAVQEPGVYTLHQNATTLLDVLSLAGGPDERAGEAAYVFRTGRGVGPIRSASPVSLDLETGEAEKAKRVELRNIPPDRAVVDRVTVDLYELLELGDLSLNMVLVAGDVVHVPEAARFYVFGYVREPGGFPLKRPTTVLDAIALARGLREREASPERCILKRRTPRGEVVVPLDLKSIARGEAPNHFLRAGDIIEVQQSSGKGFLLALWDGFKSIVSIAVPIL